MIERRCSVVYWMRGEHLDVDKLTDDLGIKPTKSEKDGPLFTEEGKILINRWILDSSLPEHEELDQHLQSLVEILRPKKDILAEYMKQGYESSFFIGVWDYGPGVFRLDPHLVKQISEIGALFQIHMY